MPPLAPPPSSSMSGLAVSDEDETMIMVLGGVGTALVLTTIALIMYMRHRRRTTVALNTSDSGKVLQTDNSINSSVVAKEIATQERRSHLIGSGTPPPPEQPPSSRRALPRSSDEGARVPNSETPLEPRVASDDRTESLLPSPQSHAELSPPTTPLPPPPTASSPAEEHTIDDIAATAWSAFSRRITSVFETESVPDAVGPEDSPLPSPVPMPTLDDSVVIPVLDHSEFDVEATFDERSSLTEASSSSAMLYAPLSMPMDLPLPVASISVKSKVDVPDSSERRSDRKHPPQDTASMTQIV
jgi:hypothetical protein